MATSTRILAVLLLPTALAAGAAHAQSGSAPATGTLWGRVVDAQTGQPLPATRVRLVELGRAELAHRGGDFHFERIAPGTYTVLAQRLGYAPVRRSVQVLPSDTVRLTLELPPSAIEVEGVVVTGTGRARQAEETYRPTTVLDGAALRRSLSSSVAATLEQEPGIAQRYNGPAASQPVIRGLSGDRVLVLEDGNRTGDVASTSADHAVTIDPLTAERIEVVRGPAGLLYGSNALGGVINVIREDVPRTLPERLTGTLSAQVESVNAGWTVGGAALGALGRVALRSELSVRRADDTRTPSGPLEPTGIAGYSLGAGGSWVHSAGFAGLAGRDYALRYGVPGSFGGQAIPGAHEGGVTIDLRRSTGRLDAAWLSELGPFHSVEVTGNYVRFEQTEHEASGVTGTRFGQLSGTGNLIARHRHALHEVQTEGAVGVWALGKDFSVAGSSTGSRPAQQLALAGFFYEELGWERLSLEVGARYDWTTIVPLDTSPGELGEVRTRNFRAVSGSAAAALELLPGVRLGASVARAFRTPSVEELFSNGPHLADFSYNIGNPELGAEFGLGVDAFLRVALPRFRLDASIFRNAIDDYIYYAPTGRLDPRFRRFPVYQAQADDALLIGAEGRAQWELRPRFVLEGTASYVRGERRTGAEPLPAIPPLQGRAGARYDGARYTFGLHWTGAAAQNRVAPQESPTPGHSLWSANAGLRWTAWDRLHTLTLQVDNLTDELWRDHLSRVKEVAPQPGRNVQLLYRLVF